MKIDLKHVVKALRMFVVKNHTEILIGTGIAASVTATVAMIPATIKAKRAIDAAEQAKGAPLTRKEKLKAGAKYYIFPVVAEATSIASIIAGAKEYRAANMMLSTSLGMLESTIPEVVGEEKAAEIKEKVAEKKVQQIPEEKFDNAQRVIVDSELRYFYEPTTGIIFQSTPASVQRGFNMLNDGIINENYQSVGDFLDFLDVKIAHRDILARKAAQDYGWNNQSYQGKHALLELPTEFKLVHRDNREVLLIEYSKDPQEMYNFFG